MDKLIKTVDDFGFPKSLIIRENALVSELIDTKDLVKELNEQLRQCNVSGRSEQFCECKFVMIMRDAETDIPYCSECGKEVNE